MALAGRELGEEALLVYSREAAPEARYLGAYEVVFAAPGAVSGESPASPPPGAPLPPAPVPPPPPAMAGTAAAMPLPAAATAAVPSSDYHLRWVSSAFDDLRSEIGSLRSDVAAHRRAMEEMLASADRRAWRLLSDWSDDPDALPGVGLAGQLLRADMDPEHVLDLMENVRDLVRTLPESRIGTAHWQKALREELINRRTVDAGLTSPAGRTVIVLAGPPGAGKTTAAMQLAAYASARGLSPRLIAFEPARLTAAQTLRSYAAVLGVPFDLTRQGDRLAALVARQPQDALLIVDGPGIGLHPDESSEQLAAFARQQGAAETWLVLPGTQRAADLQATIERLSRFGPARLLFTRTGEVRHWGAVWSAAEHSGLPLSFFCEGPRIPEDLVAASAERLAASLLAAPAVPAAAAVPSRRTRGGRAAQGRAELASAGGGRG